VEVVVSGKNSLDTDQTFDFRDVRNLWLRKSLVLPIIHTEAIYWNVFSMAAKKAKILVVDDEPEITDILEAFLSNAGHTVVAENSAAKGLERAQTFKPDMIFLDIMMPHMDGYEICNELKRNPGTEHIPVIFLTGKDTSDDQGKGFKSGGDMFIKKPFVCERLLEIVNIVLLSFTKV
jgi:CheY-like chemotaxis protein